MEESESVKKHKEFANRKSCEITPNGTRYKKMTSRLNFDKYMRSIPDLWKDWSECIRNNLNMRGKL